MNNINWDQFDQEALQEGDAIKRGKVFKIQGPRKPRGIDKNDVVKYFKKDILERLNVISGVINK